MYNRLEHHHKFHVSDLEKEKIILFWQAQAFFNIDTATFKQNLTKLLDHFTDDSLLLTVNHGAKYPLYQLVYGGEYDGLHFANAKGSAKNNYSDQLYNNLFMMGWVDKHIEMRIASNGIITYSVGYQSQHQDLKYWKNEISVNHEISSQNYPNIQPGPVLDFSDPAVVHRMKLERIKRSIKLHHFNRFSNLRGGRSDSAEEILNILDDAFKNNSYATKEGYLSTVEKIAKVLEGKTKTTKGSRFFGFGARTDNNVQLYKNILAELEDDIDLAQTISTGVKNNG